MGTRHLTVVKDSHNKNDLVVMYGQFDGYPDGHGRELAEFLKEITIVNGIPGEGGALYKVANGMECLAGQIVAKFKTEVGGFYLCPSGAKDMGEEFIYYVLENNGSPYMVVTKGPITFFGVSNQGKHADELIFDGSPKEFLKWLEEENGL